jgi:hypothetical protein
MDFRTKLDFSSNRQIKQYPETITNLSGSTHFGLPFSALTVGPDLTTTGITSTINGVVSTFSGNSGTTTYTWYDTSMSLGYPYLSALTLSNSAITQNSGVIFTSNTTTTIDGNLVTLEYSGISFDITPISIIDLGGGIYSGTVYTDILEFYSAGTLDFTGRTIWVDVSGITRTEQLIITNVGAGPGTIDIGIDANGFIVDQASDVNLKENIKTIGNALEKVLNLRGVSYNWKDRQKGGNDIKLGLIAQEVRSVVPELAYYSSSGLMGVHYKDIPALLIEAIKELASGTTIKKNNILETQTIVAEDNNIELNFNGTHQSSIGGGIIVNKGIDSNTDSKLITDKDGNWITNNSLIPKSLIIPKYTPTSSNDINGLDGDITRDDDYLYIKGNNNWKRVKLESF